MTGQRNPDRDWTVDSKETVHYISVYVQPPPIGRETEARLWYDYSHARGNFVYVVGPALPAPNQLPETYNKLQDFRLDVRHRVNGTGGLDPVVRVRELPDLRLRVRSHRHQQHRTAQHPHPRLHLPAVHGTHGTVRHLVLLVRTWRSTAEAG